MRGLRFSCIPLLCAACAASPPPAPVNVAPPVLPVAPAETKAMKVEAPSGLAAWLHVENPDRLASLIDRLGGPAKADASCAHGDLRACLQLTDSHEPLDVAFAPSESSDDAEATAFSVRSLALFRSAADKEFKVTEPRAGRLVLGTKATTSPGDASPPGKKPSSIVCDVSGAESSAHRVVCGNEEGVARLGPWLRTSPRPATNDELARAEIYREPIVAAAEKRLAGDKLVQRETRQLAHDFGGATLKLTGGDAAGAPIALDIDVRMRDSRSRWTKVLLAPLAAAAPIPETFARLPAGTTAAVYMPGGGPFVALLDQLDVLTQLTSLDPTKAKPVLDEARAVLGRPMVCGYVVDLDDGRAALAKVRRTPEKERKKAEDALDAALSGHVVCGVQAPAKAAEQLARKLIQLAPPSSGDTYAVRPAASLGLPKGSFLLETTRRSVAPAAGTASGTKAGAATRTETTLAVADGSTTWLVLANDANDVRRAAHLSSRLLAAPKGPVTAFPVESGTVVTGYVTTLLGAFFWDLATHSFDAIEKTLSDPSPGRLQISLAQHVAGPGGSVSLRLSTDAATLPTIALRASLLALPVGLLLATLASGDDSATK